MKIEILEYNQTRSRIICKVDNRIYNLPKTLIKKIINIYHGKEYINEVIDKNKILEKL